jgi:hypothetical protein
VKKKKYLTILEEMNKPFFFLYSGDLEQDTHRRRKKNENVLLHMSANPNDIKLEYKDEYGRVMVRFLIRLC